MGTGLLQTGRTYGASLFGNEGRVFSNESGSKCSIDAMDTSKECPICHGKAQQLKIRNTVALSPFGSEVEYPIFTYDCRTYGHYTITLEAKEDRIEVYWARNDTPSLAKLSAFIKEKTLRDKRGVSLREENDSASTESLPGPVFTLDEALKRFPRSVSERINRALLNLDLKAPKLYTLIHLHPHDDYPIFYAVDGNEQRYMMELLKERGYLVEEDTLGDIVVQLTADGWQRIDELQRESAEKPRQGFVAMWFGDALKKARKEGFEAGIEAAGYEALVIADRDDYNEDIHDQIIAEIRKSRFVVADFTENRPNVYYEAGFAEALGKPVIYTCHKDHIDETHFDIRQRNHIVWEDGEIDQLRNRLRNRIHRTIGLPAS